MDRSTNTDICNRHNRLIVVGTVTISKANVGRSDKATMNPNPNPNPNPNACVTEREMLCRVQSYY